MKTHSTLLGARLAVREAEGAGAHEAVIRGAAGDLTEGATSNLFLVEDGVVRTPPLEDGLLPGITRALVLEVLQELGVPFEETRLAPHRITGAGEAFLTSSSREVLPVTWTVTPGEARRSIGTGKPGSSHPARACRLSERGQPAAGRVLARLNSGDGQAPGGGTFAGGHVRGPAPREGPEAVSFCQESRLSFSPS